MKFFYGTKPKMTEKDKNWSKLRYEKTVYGKDVSYFVDKHPREGSLKAENLKDINLVLDYDVLTKELDKMVRK